jgi:RNA polymerase sigma factor (sigma-70 family)
MTRMAGEARRNEEPEPDAAYSPDSWGGETDWNLIREVSGGSGANRDHAWMQLVERYRIPVRRVLRRLLRDDPASDDAANDFFSYLFQKEIMSKIDPGQGRFRCYIQGVMKNYARSWRRSSVMPRAQGDGTAIDVAEIDVAADGQAADFEREEELVWAEAVLEHAIERLARDAKDYADLLVRFYGLGGMTPVSGDKLAREKNVTDNALHVTLHRARGKLHAALLDELRPMVSTREELVLERQLLVARLIAAHPGLLVQ